MVGREKTHPVTPGLHRLQRLNSIPPTDSKSGATRDILPLEGGISRSCSINLTGYIDLSAGLGRGKAKIEPKTVYCDCSQTSRAESP